MSLADSRIAVKATPGIIKQMHSALDKIDKLDYDADPSKKKNRGYTQGSSGENKETSMI